jgi:SWI/SNF-related matrix-associated actin-dependent regulator of chromatin subfamily A member 5
LCRVILTGTPLQNNLRELWALLHFLSPEIFTQNSLACFEDGFDLVRGVIDSNLLRRARKLLCIFMLRRVKDQVNIVLPSRKEITMLVPLTSYQVEVYKQLLCGLDSDTIETVMRESSNHTSATGAISREPSHQSLTASVTETKKITKKSSKESLNNMSVDTDWRKLMNLLLQLRKVCNHTYLLPDLMPDPYEIDEEIVNGSGKLKMLDRMLPRLKEDGHRVLIFSQFTSMLDILEDYCELREYSFVRLDGETNRVQRRLDVRRYNSPNSQLFIFLISTRAGGLGLNLASADTVILYDSDWNPQVDLQAMERAHRIGQTKPVRVYRLVCQGSIEERMVSRAEKKLFLNAMVAEADVDGDENDDINEVGAENDLANALGIGGATMSKGELASLIRFGANAVIESDKNDKSSGKEMPDAELDLLLERQGRDKVQIAASGASNEADAASAAAVDPIELAQATLRDRLEMLEEVDLRQLGNVIYKKKKVAKSREVTLDDLSDTKRVRKMRIVMVDGKGTGYGGAVPVLSDNMMQESAVVETTKAPRGRIWSHQSFCSLCAKAKHIDTPSTYRCAHCPLVFHQDCAEAAGIPRPSAMFICPHHKCSMCTRSTAAAGGMLFRCIGCLTSYCEDCLPQDEIDSVGKFRILKDLGYESKQSYYIKCPTCCTSDGDTAQGVLGDLASRAAPVAESEEVVNETEENVEAEVVELLATQAMRLQWVEEQDSEDEKKSRKRGGRKGKGRKRKSDDSDEDKSDDEEELANSKIDANIKVPSDLDLNKALDMVLNHPYGRVFEDVATLASTNKKFQMPSVSAVRVKIQSGRYRSMATFIADMRSCIEPITRLKGNMDKVAATSNVILNFFNNRIVPNLSASIA